MPLFKLPFEEKRPIIAPPAGHAQPVEERGTLCTGVVAGVAATGVEGRAGACDGGACTGVEGRLGVVTTGVETVGVAATAGLLELPESKRIT